MTSGYMEDLGLALVDAGRALVVGRESAGTDGTATGILLPGGFRFSFTGTEVTHADGSIFHGVGLVPEVPVVVTAADFAAGRDPELEAAIRALGD
jgi:C-terminal processing protease CtpA/Prc